MTSSVAGVTQTLLLIDGHSMAFRAFFALPAQNFCTHTGIFTNAVYGFTSMLLRLIETEKPTHIAVAFDLPGGTFRTEEYAEYKAGREATPEEFKGQINLIQRVLDGLGIQYLTKENYEADDILATLAFEGNASGWKVLVASGDRDSFQMITENVTVIYPGASTADLRYMTPQAVLDRYSVPPSRYPELAALVGESADNLPGVPGVGPKTAAQWLSLYDGLDNLLARADEVKGKRGEALRHHTQDVVRNRRLNHLLTDLELNVSIHDLQRSMVDRAAISSLFDQLEFNSLRKRVFALDAPAISSQAVPAESSTTSSGKVGEERDEASGRTRSVFGKAFYGTELVELTPEDGHAEVREVEFIAEPVPVRQMELTRMDEEALASLISARASGHSLSLRVSSGTDDLLSATEEIVVVGMDNTAYVARLVELSYDMERALQTFLSDGGLIVHAGKEDWHCLADLGFTLGTPSFDTQLGAYLLNADHRNATIDSLVEKYMLQVGWSVASDGDSDVLFDMSTDSDFSRRERTLAVESGALLDLATVMGSELNKVGMTSLMADMELPVQHMLARMEHDGIAIDVDRLTNLAHELERDVTLARDRAWEIAGEQINLSSPKQLQVLLFETLGLPKTKKTKTGYTTNAEALMSLFSKTGHPFLEQLLIHRDRIKLKQMVESLRAAVAPDGRIHSTFSQVVASTGRLASSEPNLQNIPARTEDGRRIRHTFVAGSGYESLLSADYSQIEMRIMAHMSEDAGLIEAFNSGEDLHSTMASMIFGIPVERVTSEERSRTKATSYGLAYGLSAYGLSQQLSISVGEATHLRERYFERFAGVQRYLNAVVAQARRDGYTSTMFGRRRYLPDLNSPQRQLREMAERAALNAPIQGTAADIMKIAMIDVSRALSDEGLASRVLVQIHDELLIEVAVGERERVEGLVKEKMASAASLSVPLGVAIGVGQSWLEAAH